ncbi:MAG: tetratricopeptide repeat protein [Candidatus Caenarcaniphilales bacterium]|nr:tetratricopeptide repeat protein [Candidatus Caenarcaniphilales bacterium]
MQYVKLEGHAPLLERVGLLLRLLIERIKTCAYTKRPEDITLTFRLVFDFIKFNFNFREKRNFIIGAILFSVFLSFSLELITHGQINEAIENHQSARAEKLIKQRLFFLRDNRGLKLRLAHAYLALGRESEAKSIVETIQNQEPSHSYIPKVGLDLSETLRRRGKAFEAINILEKVPVNSCEECLAELLELYSIEGRKSLIEKNLERANYLLTRALKLSMKLKESNSSINHRKRELSRVYNLQATELIKRKKKDKAIELLEKSVEIFPRGQTYMKLGNLYMESNGKDILTIQKSLEAYMNAYSFGVIDVEKNFNSALNLLKTELKKDGLNQDKIKELTRQYVLSHETVSIKIKEPKLSKKTNQLKRKKIIRKNNLNFESFLKMNPKKKPEGVIEEFEPQIIEETYKNDNSPASKKKRLFHRSPYQKDN